jgi:hypothetical protein
MLELMRDVLCSLRSGLVLRLPFVSRICSKERRARRGLVIEMDIMCLVTHGFGAQAITTPICCGVVWLCDLGLNLVPVHQCFSILEFSQVGLACFPVF